MVGSVTPKSLCRRGTDRVKCRVKRLGIEFRPTRLHNHPICIIRDRYDYRLWALDILDMKQDS
jgi:hypothetical protein